MIKYRSFLFIRLRRRPRAFPWMNAQTIRQSELEGWDMLRRDAAPKPRRITASKPKVKTGNNGDHVFSRGAPS